MIPILLVGGGAALYFLLKDDKPQRPSQGAQPAQIAPKAGPVEGGFLWTQEMADASEGKDVNETFQEMIDRIKAEDEGEPWEDWVIYL